jgi:hypothetical protein
MTRVVMSAVVAAALGIATVAAATDDGGLQVEVDPATGTYSMPAPGRLSATAPRTLAGDEIVITPGATAAGGFKATGRDVPRLDDDQADPAGAVPSTPAK